jgi:uncharacterized protein YcbX
MHSNFKSMVRKISGLFVYPIKGFRGISLTSANCMPEGLEHDRLWMVVDDSDNFLTQREYGIMTQFITEIVEEGIKVTFENSSIVLPFGYKVGTSKKFLVWEDECHAFYAENHLNDWLSECFSAKVKFVSMDKSRKRKADTRYAKNEEPVSFADGFPYHVLGEASLDFLNSKLEYPVPIERFRANIVFSGGNANEEDYWKEISAGLATFIGVKLCGRCIVTTIDQRTGEKNSEPLRTLATYRNENNKVNFGMNLVLKSAGIINIGDQITLK